MFCQAKEITVAQASDFYDENIRKSISKEIRQLRNQLVGIANKQIGNKYILAAIKRLQNHLKLMELQWRQ